MTETREAILPKPSVTIDATKPILSEVKESEQIRKPILPEPSRTVYAPDTLQGKADALIQKTKDAKAFYFEGSNPAIKTTQEKS